MPSKNDSTETTSALPSMQRKSTVKTPSPTRLYFAGKRRVDLDYAIGDNVEIDEGSITAMVVEVLISSSGIKYKVEWMHQGSNNSAWFDALRLNEKT